MTNEYRIFGVRHHGPGSAKALRKALRKFKPDCLLIEGPPEANQYLNVIRDPGTEPPIAMVLYNEESLDTTSFYPFAVFSPEYQAIKWSGKKKIHTEFFDLPAGQYKWLLDSLDGDERLALEDTKEDAPIEESVSKEPFEVLAEAAGYDDPEGWFRTIEFAAAQGEDTFDVVLEMMAELRSKFSSHALPFNDEREAYMRTVMRKSLEKYERVAVVCGAWHAPALIDLDNTVKSDEATLADIESIDLEVTFTPWTYPRLSYASGYGSGVESPGWYDHLWSTKSDRVVIDWFTKIAHLLRERGFDASTAQVIDATQLTESLVELRDRGVITLSETLDSALAAMMEGKTAQLSLISEELVLGNKVGAIPDSSPRVPLHRDFLKQVRQVDLPRPHPNEVTVDLDVREPGDLGKSILIRRMETLGLHWGRQSGTGQKVGSYKEKWTLSWGPEDTIQLIDRSKYGPTVHDAAVEYCIEYVKVPRSIRELTDLLSRVILADLPTAVDDVLDAVDKRSALSTDVLEMMQATPRLVAISKYRNIRISDATAVTKIADSMIVRSTLDLNNATAGVSPDAVESWLTALSSFDNAVRSFNVQTLLTNWVIRCKGVERQTSAEPTIRGKLARLLFNSNDYSTGDIEKSLDRAFNGGPDTAAKWIEGFLSGRPGMILHFPELLGGINDWLGALDEKEFDAIVPLLRRAFSGSSRGEKRNIRKAVIRINDETEAQQSNDNNDDDDEGTLDDVLSLLGLGDD